MHYFHDLLRTWFQLVEHWGYWGVFFLMALESSVFPVPSEIVMAPAAYWASQGQMNFWGVVMAGTAGSYFGSIVSYFVARLAGAPIVHAYGKYFFLSSKKIALAEAWVSEYGPVGIFLARLLPVVRHLISIPAGVFQMNVARFSAATTFGALLWCFVLSWFGQQVIGGNPQLLESPEGLSIVLRAKLGWFVGGVACLALAYGVVLWVKRKALRAKLVKQAHL